MSERTPEQDILGSAYTIEDFNSPQYDQFLNHIFNFGKIQNKTFDIADNFKVTLRLLSPAENIEVAKALDDVSNIFGKEQLLKIETLSRAIVKINGNVLRFQDSMVTEWKALLGVTDTNYKPNEVEQQRNIIRHQFSPQLINIIYSKYDELLKEQEQLFEKLKKK